ncbi:GTPase [Cohnella nanjingensis]|uniref:50S ribosome-binding GTPase n=1 Tax=Cohnella nanjingensis TaxID=1387779 RepID=A0A7X0RWK2_9BACL|nr:GTPase [Cohnella nanjingensis]MBB6673680.1 50S ribosome-binding GTPase [Cohnella nanjingensis]
MGQDPKRAEKRADAILTANFARLRAELMSFSFRGCRKVALLGQPGAGKSTLLDLLTDRGCEPRPVIGPRTDAADWSRRPDAPLILRCREYAFVDAPGYDTLAHPVDAFLQAFPFEAFDRLVLVLGGKIHEADDRLWQALKQQALASRTLVARGFAESLDEAERSEVGAELSRRFDGQAVLFSNRERFGLEQVKRFVGIA